jgi:hypothetical protein
VRITESPSFRIRRKASLVLVVLSLTIMSCQKQTMPDSVVGKWVTDDQRYVNCMLEIGTDHITFRYPGEGDDFCPIKGVSVTKKGPTSVVTIDYVNAERTSFTTKFAISPENGGELLSTNQPDVVWKRPSGKES